MKPDNQLPDSGERCRKALIMAMSDTIFRVDSPLATDVDGGENDPLESSFTPSVNSLSKDSQMTPFRQFPEWVESHPKGNDPDFVAVVAWLSMLARFKLPRQSSFHGKTIELAIGQLTLGRKQLSARSGVEESKCYRLLKQLQSEQRISIETDNQCSLITCSWINNPDEVEQRVDIKLNNERTTNEQRVNTLTKNHSYKGSKTKAKTNISLLPEEEEFVVKAFRYFTNRFKGSTITLEGQRRAFVELRDKGFSIEYLNQAMHIISMDTVQHRASIGQKGTFCYNSNVRSLQKMCEPMKGRDQLWIGSILSDGKWLES